MKRSVLFLVFVLVAILGAKAQTIIYDWNFSDATVWDQNYGGYPAGETTTVEGLSFTPGTSPANFGATNASSKTVDGVDYSTRMQMNGGGYSSAAATDVTPLVNMPTQRYLSFDVDGAVTVDIVAVTGSNSSDRAIFITDGTDLIGTFDYAGDGTGQPSKQTVNYTGGAATLYLFCNASCNIYEIIVTSNGTGIPSIDAQKPVQSVEYFNLLGRKVVDINLKQMVLIKRTTYTDGTTSISKILTKTE